MWRRGGLNRSLEWDGTEVFFFVFWSAVLAGVGVDAIAVGFCYLAVRIAVGFFLPGGARASGCLSIATAHEVGNLFLISFRATPFGFLKPSSLSRYYFAAQSKRKLLGSACK